MTDDNDTVRFSRRKLLGSVATIGAAGALGGAATNALLWDEEKFGNATNPNVLQAGQLDLKVDWMGTYYNWKDNPTFSSDGQTDQPPALFPESGAQDGVQLVLDDIKPGDVLEVTLSAHVYGNPAFLGGHYTEHADTEGTSNEPESNAADSDPEGGELDDHMYCVVWHDEGDNIPDEIWTGDTVLDEDDNGELDNEEDYVMELGAAQSPGDVFDLESDQLVFAGTLDDAHGADILYDARNAVAGEVAEAFPETACYQNSVTEYIGVLCWLPRDIPGVNDNVVQGDRVEFQFGFDAIQCRHNVANDGMPINGTLYEADAENNANSPGATPTPTPTQE